MFLLSLWILFWISQFLEALVSHIIGGLVLWFFVRGNVFDVMCVIGTAIAMLSVRVRVRVS